MSDRHGSDVYVKLCVLEEGGKERGFSYLAPPNMLEGEEQQRKRSLCENVGHHRMKHCIYTSKKAVEFYKTSFSFSLLLSVLYRENCIHFTFSFFWERVCACMHFPFFVAAVAAGKHIR